MPLEDRFNYDTTNDSSMVSGGLNGTDHSLNDEEFKKLITASGGKGGKGDSADDTSLTIGKSKAEIRRMNRKRNRKHKKGVMPTLARQCAAISCVIC